jgi:CRAL/TRIO domain/CRAL/TRIO, N-terminal domain
MAYQASFFEATAQQAKSLDIFRQALKDKSRFDEERHTDHLLYRFLRARKFDQEKTMIMFIEAEEWRKTTNVEGLVQTFAYPEHEKVFSYYPRYYHKTDKWGRTIYIEHLKNLDVPTMFSFTTQERFLTNHIRNFEKFIRYRMAACSAKTGKFIEQGTSILDLKGVPLSQFNQVRKVIQSISAISSNYYPEHMGKLVIINSPTLFTAIWVVIKGMLDDATVAKISILGSNYQKELLALVDKENLPATLGGSCSCPGGNHHLLNFRM